MNFSLNSSVFNATFDDFYTGICSSSSFNEKLYTLMLQKIETAVIILGVFLAMDIFSSYMKSRHSDHPLSRILGLIDFRYLMFIAYSFLFISVIFKV